MPDELTIPITGLDVPPPLSQHDAQSYRWQLAPAIYVDQESTKIVLANHPAEELFGYNLGEMYGMLVHDLVPDSLRHKHVEHVETFAAEPYQTARPMGQGLIVLGKHRKGHDFPVNVSLYRFVHNGRKYILAEIVDMRIGGSHPMSESHHGVGNSGILKTVPNPAEG